jgi:hypothetical protein
MPYKKPMRSYKHGGLVHVPDVVGRADESVDPTMRAMEESKKALEALKKELLVPGDNPGTKKREDRAKTHSNKPKPKQLFPGKIFRWPI